MTQPGPAIQKTQDQNAAPQWLGRALSAVHSHPWLSRIGLAVYAALATLPHTKVQWAVNEFAIRFGHPKLYLVSASIVLGLGAIFTALLLWGVRGRPQKRLVPGLWLLSLGLIVGAWAGLTGNNVELVHYPQYFPEGVLLLAMTLSPTEALCWVLLLGGLDEAYQFWLLPRSRVSLYDFNDMYMDVLGGAAGVAFAMAFLRSIPKPKPWWSDWRRPGAILVLSVIGLGVILWALGLMLVVTDKTNTHYWFALGDFRAPSFWAHVQENGPRHYHTFTPLEGVTIILATIALYGALCRKFLVTAWDRAGSIA